MLDIDKEIEILTKEISKVEKYEVPFLIIISGNPGSGKTLLAWNLSKYLKIVCLSNDYIRNKIYQSGIQKNEKTRIEVEKLVKEIAHKRLGKIFSSRASFVYDMNVNNKKQLDEWKNNATENNYQLIKIKINSNDIDNIKRIEKRKLDYNKSNNLVIGDNVRYSNNLKEEEYFKIKARKPLELTDNDFDYIIDNNMSKEEYLEKIINIVEDIRLKMLTKQ